MLRGANLNGGTKDVRKVQEPPENTGVKEARKLEEKMDRGSVENELRQLHERKSCKTSKACNC